MFTILGADGKEYGPVTAGKIHEWIIDGRANLQTKARRTGETEWRPLAEFPDFNQAGLRPVETDPAPVLPPVSPRAAAAAYAAAPRAELPPASRGLRLAAAAIDGLLRALCYVPMLTPLSRFFVAEIQNGERRSYQELSAMMNQVIGDSMLQVLPLLGVLVLIQLVLLARRGQSVGKLLTGIRIVRTDGSPAGFLHAFLLRGTVPVVIELIPILGFVFWIVDSSFIFRSDRRCLHDLIAGTVVVRK